MSLSDQWTAGTRFFSCNRTAQESPVIISTRSQGIYRWRHCRRLSAKGGAPAATQLSAAIDTLRNACITKKVPAENVLSALDQVEADVQGAHVADFPACVSGTWRLVFAMPAPIPMWAYIPVDEDAVIDVEAGRITLASAVGPLSFRFEGSCSFRCQPEQGIYDMDFSFDRWQVAAFGWERRSTREPKPKTYSFFLVDGGIAAVRSSATGGKTLMLRK